MTQSDLAPPASQAGPFLWPAPQGVYTITARLPQSDDGQFEYRIKHPSEAHERIAKESELKVA